MRSYADIRPMLAQLADDSSRFDGVTSLGVDEHVWHHVSERKRGPRALTGMVDLTRDQHGRVRARLLDLVPGRSGKAYADWLNARGEAFRKRVQVATLDPFHGYKNAIDDQLADAISVLDAFHVVKLGGQAVDEVRRRVQQAINGQRGRKGDPLYGIRNLLRCGQERPPTASRSDWRRPSTPMNDTLRCPWPGSALNNCGRSTTRQAAPRADGSRPRSSTASLAARSPRSPV